MTAKLQVNDETRKTLNLARLNLALGPALNHARGNLIDGYEIDSRMQYGPGYCSGIVRGTKRDGSFV